MKRKLSFIYHYRKKMCLPFIITGKESVFHLPLPEKNRGVQKWLPTFFSGIYFWTPLIFSGNGKWKTFSFPVMVNERHFLFRWLTFEHPYSFPVMICQLYPFWQILTFLRKTFFQKAYRSWGISHLNQNLWLFNILKDSFWTEGPFNTPNLVWRV